MTGVEVKTWTDRLQSVLVEAGGPFDRVVVVPETSSTQDAARRLDREPGTVVIACRQTAGRGRLGRTWADTGDEGSKSGLCLSCVRFGYSNTNQL